MLGAREDQEEVVRRLCEAKADPELRDQRGLNAADLALRNNHQQSVHTVCSSC
jgi:ankyrin repeat protein